MALVSNQTSRMLEGQQRAQGSRTGTRTAANFTIVLGFTPTGIRVVNLTDRVDATQIIDANLDGGSNAKGLLQVASGTTTYVDTGIVLGESGRDFTVTVATAGLETDDDDVYWEAWA